MRAGPLSDDTVIDILNRYYLPIHVTNEEYTGEGSASEDEKRERARIIREVFTEDKANLMRASDAALYILDSDGRIIDGLKLPDCLNTDQVVAMLEKNRKQLKVVGSDKPIVRPSPQAPAPRLKPGEIALHLTARYLPAGGIWKQLPSEDWIVLRAAEWKKLLPPEDAKPGQSWTVANDVAIKILSNVYPPTSNRDPATNVIKDPKLIATVVSVHDGVSRIRLDCDLEMKHRFLPVKDDNNVVNAKLVGYVDFQLEDKQVRAIRIVTETGKYANDQFAVAVRDVKP